MTVSNGLLTAAGAFAGTSATSPPSRTLEFSATFGAAAAGEHVGLASSSDLNKGPWAIFSTGTLGDQLYARTLNEVAPPAMSCSFQSRVLDAGQAAHWLDANLGSQQPTNTPLPPTATTTPTATPTNTPTATATPTQTPTPIVLVGTNSIGGFQDANPEGMAEAFQYTASASGTANRVNIYIDSTSTATQVIMGLYTNTGSNTPGTLLTQITITNPVNGAWKSAVISATSITAGTTYWIAILGPVGAGTVSFRDVASGSLSPTSSQTNLSSLPATWSPGTDYANSPLSAYLTTN